MRLTSFLVLLVVTFAASGIGFTSADLTNEAAPASFTKFIHDIIEVRRLRRRAKVAKGEGEERFNAAAAMYLMNSGRPSGQVASAVVSASRPLTKGEKAVVTLITLGLAGGGTAAVYAMYKKLLSQDPHGA